MAHTFIARYIISGNRFKVTCYIEEHESSEANPTISTDNSSLVGHVGTQPSKSKGPRTGTERVLTKNIPLWFG
ncbi:Uncharacterized protein HZ326_18143 [Fusarium oxysporum f. sp. albedinis]|nr:Uncharacterized protein HZ326_18143 [Fusarium oxysporum f. sp. albedinis]